MSTSDRPVAPAPLVENIPAELKERKQFVNWRYEWVVNKQGIGKWTKVPYTPGTTRKAASTRRSTWRSVAEALTAYQERPDFFDGIGYVFAKDDPYVGGDVDNDLSLERVPPTYAETSPSGKGTKFIARASGEYGRKTARGELYSSKRFFTITGRALPGHEQITECQADVEAFHDSLGGKERKARASSGGTGSRAQIAADILESEWEAGRQIARTSELNRTLARVRAAAKEGTQLAYVLRGDYAAFHEKWPHVGLYRNDGTLDTSQVRAVAAYGIKPRGFTFPEYAAVMSHLYAADALAKWGTKEAWRAELAALWSKAPAPGYQRTAKPTPPPKAPRGRAGNHAALVEQVYQLLLDHKAGAEAIVTASQIAGVIYCARETVARIIAELKAAGRIATRRLPRHGGLVIAFLDVIYSDQPTAALPQPHAPNDAPAVAALEETEYKNCVSSDRATDDHSLPAPTIDSLLRAALAALPRERTNPKTGQITRWPITAARVLVWLDRIVPFYRIRRADLERVIPIKLAQLRKELRNVEFARVRDLSPKALDKAIRAISGEIAKLERIANSADPTDPEVCRRFGCWDAKAGTPTRPAWSSEAEGQAIRTAWAKEASKRRGRLAMLTTERADREEREERLRGQIGYTLAEQAEMMEVVDNLRLGRKYMPPSEWRPGRAVKIAPDEPTEGTPATLLAALYRLKERTQPHADHAAQNFGSSHYDACSQSAPKNPQNAALTAAGRGERTSLTELNGSTQLQKDTR